MPRQKTVVNHLHSKLSRSGGITVRVDIKTTNYMNKLVRKIVVISIAFLASRNASDGTVSTFPEPALTEIVLRDSNLVLNPEFSPEIRKYSITSLVDSEVISLSAFSSNDEDIISIEGQIVEQDSPIQLDGVNHGDKIEISVTDLKGSKVDYGIVYLPRDFPELKTTYFDSAASDDLLYMDFFNPESNVSFAAVVDNHGVPDFYIRESGTCLLYTSPSPRDRG